jgi:ATP-binding cassette subfamily C (CFTR/MRP) protein 1
MVSPSSSTNYGSVDQVALGTEESTASLIGVEKDEETTPLIATQTAPRENDDRQSGTLGSVGHFTWLSNLTFQWFVPILDLGNQKDQLQQEDLEFFQFPENCTTDDISNTFEKHWKAQLHHATAAKSTDTWFTTPSLLMALYNSFGLEFIKAGMLKFVHDLCLFVGPQVLNGLIHFLRDPNAPLSHGIFLTFLVTASQLVMTFCLRHYFFKCYLTGLQIRSAVVMAVYNKALVLKSSERQSRSLGEITNLVSIDAQRMQDLTTYLHAIWYSFLQIGLALYFLWGQLGVASLGGVAVMIIMMPLTKSVAQWLAGIQKKLMVAKDARVQLNSELLSSMKVIKLQAWEEPFQSRLMVLRNVELQQLWHYVVAQTLSMMMWTITPLAVALATFGSYIWLGHELEVASALTALALFDILRFPLFMLPQVINRIVEASVSLNRIKSFLLCEEYEAVGCGSLDDVGIKMENASFVYESRKPKPIDGVAIDPATKALLDKEWEIELLKSQLRDAEQQLQSLVPQSSDVEVLGDAAADLLCLKRINFQCRRGELVAVVGGVGCGKSSFVNAVLGEIRQVGGNTTVKGKLSYFTQSAFILNDTVRNNILFGHTNEAVDEERYKECLSSCALAHDLKLLPAGDQTEIGEKVRLRSFCRLLRFSCVPTC